VANASKSKTVILGIAAAAVMIASLSVGPSTTKKPVAPGPPDLSAPSKSVSIELTGWTESPAGLPAAKLKIRNDHPKKAILFASALAVRIGDSWTTNTPPPKWTTDAFDTLRAEPGSAQTHHIPVPSYDGSWKITLTITHQESGLDGLKQKVTDEWKTRTSGAHQVSFTGDFYQLETVELDAPPPPPIVAVHHIGRTNDARGKPAVILRFTNRSPVAATFRPRSVITLNEKGRATNFTLSAAMSAAFAGESNLEPRGSKTVVVPFPDDRSTWFLETVIHPKRDSLSGAIGKTADKLQELKSGQHRDSSTGESYFIKSPGMHHLRK
jgi:hypothetical protein